MPKYNIYKVSDSKLGSLIDHLESNFDFEQTQELVSANYTLRVYFANASQASRVEVWWLKQYGSKFFGEYAGLSNRMHSGLIIAWAGGEPSKPVSSYVIPLGKAHFYIQGHIDRNFGFEIAERIADPSAAKAKSSKSFGGKTSKSLVSYIRGSQLDFSSGDSTEYLKLKPRDEGEWGKSYIHFGTSIQFGSIDIGPDDLGLLFEKLDTVMDRPKSFKIPLMRPIGDESAEANLYRELGGKISSGGQGGGVEIADFRIYGTEFLFSSETHFQLAIGSDFSDMLSDLTLSDISSFASQSGVDLEDNLLHIKVRVMLGERSRYSTRLVDLIEYHSEDGDAFIYEGKWFVFNGSFIEQLADSLSSIKSEVFPDKFSEREYVVWRDQKDEKLKYREMFVIDKIRQRYGYEVYDRDIHHISYDKKRHKIEVGDIYDKENKRIIVVKIGEPKDFGYAFDQAIATLNAVKNGYFISDDSRVRIEAITLLLVFRSNRKLKTPNDIASLIFKLKLDGLRKIAQDKGVDLRLVYSNIV